VDKLFIKYTAFVRYCRSGNIIGQYISHLQILRRSMTVRREELYNILNEFGIPMKLIWLIKCV